MIDREILYFYEIKKTKMIKGYFDGACEPINPYGNMGIGAILLKDNETIFSHSEFVPASKSNSNNVAEYMALEKILTS